MPGKNDLIRLFKTAQTMNIGAKFFKADLHFHTPASADARGKNRYNFNPYKLKYPSESSPDYIEKLDVAQAKIAKDARKVAADIVNRFLEENLSMVAITDHNGIGTIWNDAEADCSFMDLAAPLWYEVIDDEAQKVNKKAGKTVLTILPGVEISTSGVHVLAIFPPQNPRRKVHFMICDLLCEVGIDIDRWGKNPSVGTASSFDAINLIVKKGGFPILAHIDGSDQALLKLHGITSGSMKNVLREKNLLAVEIVDPSRFIKQDRKLKTSKKKWIDTVRSKEELPFLSFFQGSDAHCLADVAKRHTFVKMTEPSFPGLKTALYMPSSRIRISDMHQPISNGLFLHSLAIENKHFGKKIFRFNRHMNCVVGKKNSGKTFLFDLMQSAVHSEFMEAEGKTALYVEQIIDSVSHYYVFSRDRKNDLVEPYKIDPQSSSATAVDPDTVKHIRPKFYDAEKMEQIITSSRKLNDFLVKRIGSPSKTVIRNFNDRFAITHFLEEKKIPLLLLALDSERQTYTLWVNTGWPESREKMVDFFKLSYSMRRTAMMCMIIIMSRFGPAIIDAPEADFDQEDIINFLIPIIKKYKDFQQVILFSKNAMLTVNTDPDNYILLGTTGTRLTSVTSGFSIDDQNQKEKVLNIVEGSLKSFKKRAVRYAT